MFSKIKFIIVLWRIFLLQRIAVSRLAPYVTDSSSFILETDHEKSSA